MSGTLRNVTHTVALERELNPAHGETAENGFQRVTPGAIDLDRDRAIEAREHRKDLLADEGDIAILLTPSDELGEFTIGLQFEGPVEKHDECLADQGEMLQQASGWLRDILSTFETDWDLELTTVPCPKGDSRNLRLHELLRQLKGEREGAASVDRAEQRSRTRALDRTR